MTINFFIIAKAFQEGCLCVNVKKDLFSFSITESGVVYIVKYFLNKRIEIIKLFDLHNSKHENETIVFTDDLRIKCINVLILSYFPDTYYPDLLLPVIEDFGKTNDKSLVYILVIFLGEWTKQKHGDFVQLGDYHLIEDRYGDLTFCYKKRIIENFTKSETKCVLSLFTKIKYLDFQKSKEEKKSMTYLEALKM